MYSGLALDFFSFLGHVQNSEGLSVWKMTSDSQQGLCLVSAPGDSVYCVKGMRDESCSFSPGHVMGHY